MGKKSAPPAPPPEDPEIARRRQEEQRKAEEEKQRQIQKQLKDETLIGTATVNRKSTLSKGRAGFSLRSLLGGS